MLQYSKVDTSVICSPNLSSPTQVVYVRRSNLPNGHTDLFSNRRNSAFISYWRMYFLIYYIYFIPFRAIYCFSVEYKGWGAAFLKVFFFKISKQTNPLSLLYLFFSQIYIFLEIILQAPIAPAQKTRSKIQDLHAYVSSPK